MTQPTVGIVVSVNELNVSSAPTGAIQNLIDIYESNVKKIWIIGPSMTNIKNDIVELASVDQMLSSHGIINYVSYQINLGKKLRHLCSKIDVMFFHIGGNISPMAVLISRLFDSTPIVINTGSPSKLYKIRTTDTYLNSCIAKSINFLELLTYHESEGIIHLSDSTKNDIRLNSSPTKEFTANLNYIKSDVYETRTPVSKRNIDIIFVGRFAEVKGIKPLAEALNSFMSDKYPISVKLVGDGNLRDDIESRFSHEKLNTNIEFTGWINRDGVIKQLSDARIIIIPSHSEGLPKVLLEGMACGTIPIVTRVGGMTDVIEESKNGFFITDKSPSKIKQKLDSVLDRDDLDKISQNAQQFIIENYSFDQIKSNYMEILSKFS
jgi:glycosyltransferase involved in cell wall biosynthesis